MSYPVDRRRDLLFALADVVRDHFAELSELNVHDYGVPIAVAGNSVLTERFLRYYAGYVDKSHGASTPVAGAFDVNIVEREPYGVVGVLAPWNGPLVVVGAAVAPAVAAGNAVILKPSEVASLAPLRFGELCLEAGLPPGLVNVVPAGRRAATPWCVTRESARSTSPADRRPRRRCCRPHRTTSHP